MDVLSWIVLKVGQANARSWICSHGPLQQDHMTDKQQSPAGSLAKQKGLVPTAWLTGHLPATFWWLQLSAAMYAGSAAPWQALTAVLHTTSARFCIAHLPTEPAGLKEDAVRC